METEHQKNTQELNRQFTPNFWAQILGRVPNRTAILTPSALLLSTAAGAQTILSPEQCLGPVEIRWRTLWHTIVIHAPGRAVYLRGLRRGEARAWRQALNLWQTPARLASLEPLRQSLITVSRACETLWLGNRYVRTSEHLRLVDRMRHALGALANSRWALWSSDSDRVLQKQLQDAISQAEDRRAVANQVATREAMTRFKELLDRIERQPLTDVQRKACVVDDDNNLVLAGAGSGKTSVIIGRIAYLLSSKRATSNQILALAYNREAAKEMEERVRARIPADARPADVTVRTFHGFGSDVIAAVEGRKPSLSKLAEDAVARGSFVASTLERLLAEPGYLSAFIEYGFDHFDSFRSAFDFDSLEEYERNLAGQDRRTLSGDLVKSTEELRIANWLTQHGVHFHYEAKYPGETADAQHRAYRPDFTICRASNPCGPVFLEHFGIDENGSPPPFFTAAEAEIYREAIVWKRDLHKRNGTALVETYSFEFRRGTIFANLADRLRQAGVELKPRSESECLEILRGTHVVSNTGALFSELIPVCRELGLDNEIADRIEAQPHGSQHRSRLLWKLLDPILSRYRETLKSENEIDFGEMLHRAIGYIQERRYTSPFRDILVDEFQDISEPRANLVKALRDQGTDVTLFCVGDDWQSIYRFSGSDVGFTTEFEQRIGLGSTLALDKTFRFNNQICSVASRFVTQNPAQTRKMMSSVQNVTAPAVSLVATADVTRTVAIVLNRIADWGKVRATRFSVRILARYWYELDDVHGIARSLGRELGLDIELSSVHAAKGLEADFVILLGLGEGQNGFPANKPIELFRELFLPAAEPFGFAEERRLFYVALTRARHRVYLLYDTDDCSEFIRELKVGGYAVTGNEFRDENLIEQSGNQ